MTNYRQTIKQCLYCNQKRHYLQHQELKNSILNTGLHRTVPKIIITEFINMFQFIHKKFIFAAFGLGTMIYNGLELGTFFEIPWNSPCYQVLRGINPILQMIFTFSQMYFVFMNARVSGKEKNVICIMYVQILFSRSRV